MKDQITLFDLVKFNEIPDKYIPEGVHLKNKQFWCPYCSNIVVFKRDKKSGVMRCPICNISNKDFWVKKINKL
ncbi:hypothetical protein JYG23_07275 [Sedimentibacter sp. zth1]|uniref:hypothetical protein n=1 Tax=Sedimentibacter sp. zth1 TaxID=2816908 RepID=UPI001A9325C5|nr:hypothetical protein [Sedimentibacter sp. zth1]QSX07137.1 hypothetical protein JYG23_07275 [Sedimentibacter sp. zth1]